MFTLQLLGTASLDGPDGPVAGRAGMRQRVALLALLAVEHPRPVSRDKLLAFLWPESGIGEARQLLRTSLHILRSALGDDAVLSTGDDLRLSPDYLTCDLWEFEAALARGDPEAAVGVYQGPFLSGFHLSDAEEFERWAEGERSRLAHRYVQALEYLAERETRGGDPLRAVEWWSRLAGEDPYNSRIALRYMQALDGAGDRAGALRHASAHAELLRTELDAVPEAEVVALAERFRLESRAAAGGAPAQSRPGWNISVPTESAGRDATPASPTAVPGRRTHRGWILPAVLGLGVVVGVGVVGGALSRDKSPPLNPQRVAVAVFENHTGRSDLDDLGSMTADWIIRGLMETPLVDVTDLETVYAGAQGHWGQPTDPRTLARRNGAGLVISGNYYRSVDSVIFQSTIVEVASGRVLRSLVPVGAPIDKPAGAVEALRQGVAAGLGVLLNRPSLATFPFDPDLIQPPKYPAYREFIAGIKLKSLNQWESETRHYRRSAELDSSFVAPLILLAFRATFFHDQCHLTDSIGTVLDRRREHLTTWDRITIDMLRARCRGEMAAAVQLLRQRLEAYPRSTAASRQYARALLRSNQPTAARSFLSRFDPEINAAKGLVPEETWARDPEQYWPLLAACHHVLAQYSQEIEITDRWRDSGNVGWMVTRGRALSALGREREALDLLQSLLANSIDLVANPGLTLATELAVHGHPETAMIVAESILTRLELGPGAQASRARDIAWANRLLGRKDQERSALEQVAGKGPDTLAVLEAKARLAVLLSDTVQAERIDSILAEQSSRPLRSPWVRGAQILARAHIAAGFGRREQAVARLREVGARGMLQFGPSHAYHHDVLLTPLRGYAPFEALLKPDN